MALIFNNAEGGTNGSSVTVGNSGGGSGTAFSTVSAGSGGTITYTNANVFNGALAYNFNQPTAATACLVDLDDASPSTDVSVAVMVYVTSYPTATNAGVFFGFRSLSGSLNSGMTMDATGRIGLNLNSSFSTYSSSALALNTWYRLECYGTGWGGSTSMTLDAYVGNATGTPYTTASKSGITTSAQVQRIRWGKASGSPAVNVAFILDDIRENIGSATPLGVATYNASPPPAEAAATGTAYDALPTIHNASSGPVTVDAQVASAGVTAPFDPAGVSISIDQLMLDAVYAVGVAGDITPGVGPSAPVAGATGVANDATAVPVSQVVPDAGLASASSAAFDATVHVTPGVFPLTTFAISEAFDATVTVVVITTNVDGPTAEAVGEALNASVLAISDIILYFTTPTVKETGIRRNHGLFDRLYLDRGVSVLRFGGSFQVIDNPSTELMESANALYIGGRTYAIHETEANLLRSAGYGHWVTEDPNVPIPEIDFTQYGVGVYGAGPYGA